MKHVNPLTMRGDHTEPIQRLNGEEKDGKEGRKEKEEKEGKEKEGKEKEKEGKEKDGRRKKRFCRKERKNVTHLVSSPLYDLI